MPRFRVAPSSNGRTPLPQSVKSRSESWRGNQFSGGPVSRWSGKLTLRSTLRDRPLYDDPFDNYR